MFLDLLRRRNPALLEAAATLHRDGKLPPNCYAIDLDAVGRNAAAIRAEADRLGLKAFAMTKQIGRNPDVSRRLVESGISHSVAVDLECGVAAASGGLRTGHIGHLVQIPRHSAGDAAALEPLYWTVFNDEKAREAAAAAQALGRTQDLLARIISPQDKFYRGHEGGFPADEVVAVADRLDALPGARFAGITTFPTALFDAEAGKVRTTSNLETLRAAAAALRAAGRTDIELNTPGTTSTAMLELLAEAGATQVEPGHGLTGTTPWHAVEDLVEDPAIVYVSEVSHLWNDSAYVFGGGLYVDPVLGSSHTSALVVNDAVERAPVLAVDMPAPEAIDYYATIPLDGRRVAVGDTVLFGFRPQVFVTRGLTAAISGISTGTPKVEGVWAANGAAPLSAHDVIARGRI
ncbi:YhfX family PLP-dependent enzyme [Planosporangium flavigriseum]|uniref:Amino-acid racemase n=1 Tax=Planosporangium flavigriseum TaxID=373681 RepID=A0A8J3LPX9_9ACTN|nr:alanine racemase [Planosporangium flavigriseum]NJC63126.1 YhfX family PLP-dependent enzyme [Planosporangium flavigriseum]GIG74503.1 amino-acid racemase [Planosporangium flavigriseum]